MGRATSPRKSWSEKQHLLNTIEMELLRWFPEISHLNVKTEYNEEMQCYQYRVSYCWVLRDNQPNIIATSYASIHQQFVEKRPQNK